MTHTTDIAIVGDGPAALAALGALREAGVPGERVRIYGDSAYPMEHLERYARAVSQERMRSEGDGHLAQGAFPGLALIESLRRRSPGPVLASLLHVYTPPLDLLLEHSAGVAERYGFAERHVMARVGRLERRERPRCEFLLHGEDGEPLGSARHVLLALGQPGLHWPAAAGSWRFHPRVSHAYQRPSFAAGERVVVVGSGIAAAHLWVAGLAAGATVVALHRSPLRRQQLNASRCMFSSVGIEAYQRLTPEERLAALAGPSGSYPPRLGWEWRLWRAGRQGRFVDRQAGLARIERGEDGGHPLRLWLSDGDALAADRVIFATGFRPDAEAHPIIRRLVDEYGVACERGMLRPADDMTLPPLSRPESRLAVLGALARWALPVAGTFFGMKYAARRLVPLLAAAPAAH